MARDDERIFMAPHAETQPEEHVHPHHRPGANFADQRIGVADRRAPRQVFLSLGYKF